MSVNRVDASRVVPGSITTRRPPGAQAGLQGSGTALAQGRQAAGQGRVGGRGGATGRRGAEDGGGVAALVGGEGPRRPQAPRARTAARAVRRAVRRTRQAAGARCAGPRISYRAVDAAMGGQADQATLRRRVFERPHLASAAPARLLLPEAGLAGDPARRGRNRALEEAPVAGSRKNAARGGQTIDFIYESAVSERPTMLCARAPRGQTPII